MADTTLENSTEKGIAWATILYPESCCINFLEIINSSGFPCALSPLHDQDVDEDGVLKKPHYHLLIWFKGSRRRSQVEKLRIALKAVGLEKINNPSGYARYLCHLDDLDKAQYDKENVQCFNGLDYTSILAKGIDKTIALIQILDMLESCKSFLELTRKVKAEYPEYIGILSKNAYFYINLMKEKGENHVSNSCRKKEVGIYPTEWKYDTGNESPFTH